MRRRTVLALGTGALLLIGGAEVAQYASQEENTAGDGEAGRPPRRLVSGNQGTFEFDGCAAVEDHPINVAYHVPEGDLSAASVLIVLPGTNRNAADYARDWEDVVESRNVAVFAPEFDEKHYPAPQLYNLGGIIDEDDDWQPYRLWTLTVPEAIFRAVRADTGIRAESFSLFGHSAGAQFVHRLVMFDATAPIDRAVSANAGWYTVPDESEAFPYGLADGPTFPAEPAFSRRLTVLLGANDTDADDENLRHDDGADAQGDNRFERGQFFFEAAQAAAAEQSLTLRWDVQTVSDIAHDHEGMAKAAVEVLFGPAT